MALSALVVALPLRAAHAAGGRLALVIGNGRYEAQPPLANAVRDARAVADTLGRIGFAVERREDLGRRATVDALLDFADRARQAEVVLVYYAGHGIQVAGHGDIENYLVPVDARLSDVRKVADEAVPLSRLLDELAGRGTLVVLLDACRDNPLAARMAGQGTRASVGRGLARVPEGDVAQGSLIAFAAAPGQVAEDGQGRLNGPFAAALVKNLPAPGVDVGLLLQWVALDVEQATGRRQRPEVVNRLRRREPLYLAGPEQLATVPTPSPERTALRQEPVEDWEQRAAARRGLRELGYYAGRYGPEPFDEETRQAVRRFQTLRGDPVTGTPSPEQQDFLAMAGRRLPALLERPDRSPSGVAAAAVRTAEARYARAWAADNPPRGRPRAPAEAAYWYALAARDGEVRAYTQLGVLLARGQSVGPPDPDAAALVWHAAAVRGEATAAFNLGALYERGLGLPPDRATARLWYNVAAGLGNAGAAEALRRLGS